MVQEKGPQKGNSNLRGLSAGKPLILPICSSAKGGEGELIILPDVSGQTKKIILKFKAFVFVYCPILSLP